AAPRETGTDYRNAPDAICNGVWSFAAQTATQHFPLAAEAGYALHGESRLFKATPDEAGTGKGGQCSVRVTEAGNFIKYFLAPHGLVAGRGESIQKPRINVRLTQHQHVKHIAEGEGQLHARVAETASVKAGRSGRVVFQQVVGLRTELRPALQGAREILRAQWKLFRRDKMQACASRGVFKKRFDGNQEIKSGTEACFANDEHVAGLQRPETLHQLVAID